MADDWSLDDVARCEAFVRGLRAKPLTAADLGALHQALTWQARLLAATVAALEHQAQEVQVLRAMLAEQDDPRPWDRGDERHW